MTEPHQIGTCMTQMSMLSELEYGRSMASGPPPELSFSITEEWIAGFFDGECNIGIYGNPLQPRCRINQRDDDGDLVRAIRAFLGVGALNHTERDKKIVNAKPQMVLSVAGADCMRMVALFDRHPLRSKKRFEYPFWREACLIYASMTAHRWNGRDLIPKRTSLLLPLKKGIDSVRAYAGPR